jgi:cytochrome c
MRFPSTGRSVALIAGVLSAAVLAGIVLNVLDDRADLRAHAAATTGGDPARGEAMFIQYGCGSCHKLRNVRQAAGTVGPPLDGIALRAIIGGKLNNDPASMQRWIRDPHDVTPGTAMPDLRVGERDARDITAFLYTRGE